MCSEFEFSTFYKHHLQGIRTEHKSCGVINTKDGTLSTPTSMVQYRQQSVLCSGSFCTSVAIDSEREGAATCFCLSISSRTDDLLTAGLSDWIKCVGQYKVQYLCALVGRLDFVVGQFPGLLRSF